MDGGGQCVYIKHVRGSYSIGDHLGCYHQQGSESLRQATAKTSATAGTPAGAETPERDASNLKDASSSKEEGRSRNAAAAMPLSVTML